MKCELAWERCSLRNPQRTWRSRPEVWRNNWLTQRLGRVFWRGSRLLYVGLTSAFIWQLYCHFVTDPRYIVSPFRFSCQAHCAEYVVLRDRIKLIRSPDWVPKRRKRFWTSPIMMIESISAAGSWNKRLIQEILQILGARSPSSEVVTRH